MNQSGPRIALKECRYVDLFLTLSFHRISLVIGEFVMESKSVFRLVIRSLVLLHQEKTIKLLG
jgi:hypothetical protein